jgi:hypothetical protein
VWKVPEGENPRLVLTNLLTIRGKLRSGGPKTLVFPRKNALEARVGIALLKPLYAVFLPVFWGISTSLVDLLQVSSPFFSGNFRGSGRLGVGANEKSMAAPSKKKTPPRFTPEWGFALHEHWLRLVTADNHLPNQPITR